MNDRTPAMLELLFESISNGSTELAETRRGVEDLLADAAETHRRGQLLVQKHPLGFLALRYSLDELRSFRIHLWHREFTWAQEPHWPIHDHFFSFNSLVLRGSVLNKTYSVESAESTTAKQWGMYEVAYDSQVSALNPLSGVVEVHIASTNLQTEGSTYSLEAGVLHRSSLKSKLAVTALATVRSLTFARARVIGPAGQGPLVFNRAIADGERLPDSLRFFLSEL